MPLKSPSRPVGSLQRRWLLSLISSMSSTVAAGLALLGGCDSDPARRNHVADCVEESPGQCPAGCIPVVSVPRSIARVGDGCIHSGVHFGCTQALDDPMWTDPNKGFSGPHGLCSPKPGTPFSYCFVGRQQVYWYMHQGGYLGFCDPVIFHNPLCDIPPPPKPEACLHDYPDDNISPPYPISGELDDSLAYRCVRAGWPLPLDCYTE